MESQEHAGSPRTRAASSPRRINPQSESAPSILDSNGNQAPPEGPRTDKASRVREAARYVSFSPDSEALPAQRSSFHRPSHGSTGPQHLEDRQDGAPPNQRPRGSAGARRNRSPKLTWKHAYSSVTERRPRILVLDYVINESAASNNPKIRTYEFHTVEQIKRLYGGKGRTNQTLLRVFHVQNFHEAAKFLLDKFMVREDVSELVRSNFGKYVLQPKPDRRGGVPKPSSRTWDTEHDPWRGISRTSFILDYLRYYDVAGCDTDCPPGSPEHHYSSSKAAEVKVMELNGYDDHDDPAYKFDVCVQRSGIYVQYRNNSAANNEDVEAENPYKVPPRGLNNRRPRYVPDLERLDNGNAIIIFDDSMNGNIYDTLIAPRKGLEERWRRLLFHLNTENSSAIPISELAFECMKAITEDYFKRGLKMAWKSLLDRTYEHVSILQNKIFAEPADESRANELWLNSAMWLVLEKTLARQKTATEDMQAYLSKLTGGDEPQFANNLWLRNVPDELGKINTTIQEDLVGPTAQLADLMYKSVGIRDSRHSLELNTSLWRLSWITFIFLPLTFLVGFFGMNVDTFSGNGVELRYYFAAAIPFAALVVIVYNAATFILAKARRASPYSRGVYEDLFLRMASRSPDLWSRYGPRAPTEFRGDVAPLGRWAAFKWWIIRKWTSGPADDLRRQRQLLSSSGHDDEGDDIHAFDIEDDAVASWASFQRTMIRKWTKQLDRQLHRNRPAPHDEEHQVLVQAPTPRQSDERRHGARHSMGDEHDHNHGKQNGNLLFGYDNQSRIAAIAPVGDVSALKPGNVNLADGGLLPADAIELPDLSSRLTGTADTLHPASGAENPRPGAGAHRTESDPSAVLRRPNPTPKPTRASATGVISPPSDGLQNINKVRQSTGSLSAESLTKIQNADPFHPRPSAEAARRSGEHGRTSSTGGRDGPRSSFSASAGSDTGSEAMVEETLDEWLAHRYGGAVGRGRHAATVGGALGSQQGGGYMAPGVVRTDGFNIDNSSYGAGAGQGPRGTWVFRPDTASTSGPGGWTQRPVVRSGSLARAVEGGIDAIASSVPEFGGQFASRVSGVEPAAGSGDRRHLDDDGVISPVGRTNTQPASRSAVAISRGRPREGRVSTAAGYSEGSGRATGQVRDLSTQTGDGRPNASTATEYGASAANAPLQTPDSAVPRLQQQNTVQTLEALQRQSAQENIVVFEGGNQPELDSDGDGVPDRVEDARQRAWVDERNNERRDGAYAEHGKGRSEGY